MKNIFEKIIPVFFVFIFIWGIIYLSILHFTSFNASVGLGQFDQSLRLISALYASNGLIPYNDFAFVYPPGQIFIFSIINTGIEGIFKLNTLISLLISASLLIFTLHKTRSIILSGTATILLVINYNVLSSPYTETLWIWLVLLTLLYFSEKQKNYLYGIFALCIALLLNKWDRVLALGFIAVAIYLASFIPNLKFSNDFKKKLKKLTLTIISSAATAFVILISFLLISGSNIQKSFYFIFNVPLKIGPYRDLPLFSDLNISDGKIIYLFLIILMLILIMFARSLYKRKINYELLLTLILSFSTLPYAFGRSDVSHFLPLITTLTLCLAYYSKNIKIFGVILVASIIYIFYAFNLLSLPKPNANFLSQIKDCSSRVKNQTYNSIFIGREEYSDFLINNAALYLVNPSVKPASSYISDEPGLQNNCTDGEIVAEELKSAEKPMLIFLETSKQNKEPNLSSKMQSCRKIENYLESTSFKQIGACKSYGSTFDIRIYDYEK